MPAKSWPRNVCREVMDGYPEILQMTIPKWEGKDAGLYQRCSDVWTDFTHLAALISGGCEPNFEAWQHYAADLDAVGAYVLKSVTAVSTNEAVRSPYMHALACNFGNMVRRWGPLNQYSSQACESLHQRIKTFCKAQQQEAVGAYLFGKHRCTRKGGANRRSCHSISSCWEEEGGNGSHENGK
jgi:hypothetical protein